MYNIAKQILNRHKNIKQLLNLKTIETIHIDIIESDIQKDNIQLLVKILDKDNNLAHYVKLLFKSSLDYLNTEDLNNMFFEILKTNIQTIYSISDDLVNDLTLNEFVEFYQKEYHWQEQGNNNLPLNIQNKLKEEYGDNAIDKVVKIGIKKNNNSIYLIILKQLDSLIAISVSAAHDP